MEQFHGPLLEDCFSDLGVIALKDKTPVFTYRKGSCAGASQALTQLARSEDLYYQSAAGVTAVKMETSIVGEDIFLQIAGNNTKIGVKKENKASTFIAVEAGFHFYAENQKIIIQKIQ